MHTSDESPDLDAMRLLALRKIQMLSRDEALGLALHHCTRRAPGDDQKSRLAWLHKAQKARTLEARCLGWFDLDNPNDPDLPWPAISFYVRAGDRMASLSLYLNGEGAWEVADDDMSPRQDGKQRPGVNWERYRGNPAGPWNAINGDEPVRRTDQRAGTESRPVAPAGTGSPDVDLPPLEVLAAASPPVRSPARRSSTSAKPGTLRKSSTKPASPTPDKPDRSSVREEIVLRLLRLLQGE